MPVFIAFYSVIYVYSGLTNFILNLQTAVVFTCVASPAEQNVLVLSAIHRLYSGGKAILFVVCIDFTMSCCRELQNCTSSELYVIVVLLDIFGGVRIERQSLFYSLDGLSILTSSNLPCTPKFKLGMINASLSCIYDVTIKRKFFLYLLL